MTVQKCDRCATEITAPAKSIGVDINMSPSLHVDQESTMWDFCQSCVEALREWKEAWKDRVPTPYLDPYQRIALHQRIKDLEKESTSALDQRDQARQEHREMLQRLHDLKVNITSLVSGA